MKNFIAKNKCRGLIGFCFLFHAYAYCDWQRWYDESTGKGIDIYFLALYFTLYCFAAMQLKTVSNKTQTAALKLWESTATCFVFMEFFDKPWDWSFINGVLAIITISHPFYWDKFSMWVRKNKLYIRIISWFNNSPKAVLLMYSILVAIIAVIVWYSVRFHYLIKH